MSEKKEKVKAKREREKAEKAEREREKERARKTRDEAAFALTHSTVHLMQRAQQVGADLFAKHGHPVSLRQFGVLAAIAANPNASQSDLVRAASIDRSTLADMLKRLELMGLVAKSASETDARANTVALTERGREVLRGGVDDAREADQAVLRAVSHSSKTKRRVFQEALENMARKLDDEAEETAKEEKRKRKEAAAKLRKEERKRKERTAQ